MQKSFSIITLLFSLSAFSQSTFDKTEELFGVDLKSGKTDSTRSYYGSTEKKFPFSLEIVRNNVTNFTDKCNNSYKGKRSFTSTEIDCKYHNEHLIESFVVKDLKPQEDFKNYTENYLLGRLVYNRGQYGFYDLVQIQEGRNQKNQKTVTVNLRMLNTEEVKLMTEPKIEKESAFNKTQATFILTELSPNETQVSYSYSAETSHWLLNKEVAVPQVFASISKSINDLMKTIDEGSTTQKREIASK
jgi:hypothetical protein